MRFDVSFFLPLDHICATCHSSILKWREREIIEREGSRTPFYIANRYRYVHFVDVLFVWLIGTVLALLDL